MGEYVSKQGIINLLTNLYDNFNDYCKLPKLEETSMHVWGKEVHYGLDDIYKTEVKSVHATMHIPLQITLEELNNYILEDLPNVLRKRTEDFFFEETSVLFTPTIAPQFILHYLNHWEPLRNEDGQPVYHTYNFDGRGYLDITFVRYMAITPNVDYKGPGLEEKGTVIPPYVVSPRKKLFTLGINLETCYYAKDKDEAIRHFMQQLSEAVKQGRYKDYFTIEEG